MTATQRSLFGGVQGAVAPGVRWRFVIDPIWRVIDMEQYRSLWKLFSAEAASYGFVGFDMEWSTRLHVADTDKDQNGPVKTSRSSARSNGSRQTGPVATIQLSTYSCTFVVKWLHLHVLTAGDFANTISDPYAPASAHWPCYREGQKRNSVADLGEVYNNIFCLICDQNIFKVGVGIHGDEVKLLRDYPSAQLRSAVDLAELADACLPETVLAYSCGGDDQGSTEVRTASLRSLKKLCRALTGRELGKDMAVVMSDWGGCHGALTPLQIEYAAEDAEASYDVCIAILKGGGFMVDRPASVRHSDYTSTNLPWCTVKELDCREVLACCITDPANNFQGTLASPKNAASSSEELVWDAGQMGVGASVPKAFCSSPAAVEERSEARWCKGRERPYYDNIRVFNPDMQLVFTVDKSKADWYVNKKGLARVVEWRTPTGALVMEKTAVVGVGNELEVSAIQLSFAPDFARYNDVHIRRNMNYFKQPKENICVVCGSGGSLVRFAVVPLMYRRFFPSVYMSHNSYDLLLLCPHCFGKSRLLYDRLRRGVAEDFGIPLVHLRVEQRDLYADAVRQMAHSIDILSGDYEEAKGEVSSTPGKEGVPERDFDLHPRLSLRVRQDYLSLMVHREILDRVFSFAKALHYHYEYPQRQKESCDSGDADMGEENVAGDSSGGVVGHLEKPKRRMRVRRRHAPKAGTAPPPTRTILPEERRSMMADYLRRHASAYPFFLRQSEDESTRGGWDLQNAVFHADCDGAASAQGVRFILTGVADAPDTAGYVCKGSTVAQHSNSSRSVLTRYWLSEHPELLTLLPTFTRAEERLRYPVEGTHMMESDGFTPHPNSSTSFSEVDGGALEAPYVDSHAFQVVRLLLEKYTYVSSSAKTSEHAVGQFIFRWRSSFVAGMQPRHLPHGWVPEDGILL